jgi:hypothetical protein
VAALAGGDALGRDAEQLARAGSSPALAELLERDGREVEQLRGSLADASPDPDATVFVLGAGRLSSDEALVLEEFLRAGGRLVAGADPRLAAAYPLADLVLLAVYADSVRRRRTGAPLTWKGRTYPAGDDPGPVASLSRPPGRPGAARS